MSPQGRSRLRVGRWSLSSALGACALLWCSAGFAQSSPDELARRHFESGVAYLEESDYENALTAFRKAHELSGRPEILLNIATVHERLGQFPKAVMALRGYLETAPQGEHVETVRRRIENLEKRSAETAPAPDEPPQSPAEPPPPPLPVTPEAAPPAEPEPPQPPASAPSRVPVFIAFGAGALSAAGAVVTGLLANAEYDDAEKTCKPSCSDDDLATGRGLALTSTILTGVAVIGAGVGVTLLLLEPGKPEARARAPRLELGLRAAPWGSSVNGVLRF